MNEMYNTVENLSKKIVHYQHPYIEADTGELRTVNEERHINDPYGMLLEVYDHIELVFEVVDGYVGGGSGSAEAVAVRDFLATLGDTVNLSAEELFRDVLKARRLLAEMNDEEGGEARTDRDHVTLAKNHVLTAIEELEKADAYNSVRGIIGILENAEDGLADALESYENDEIERPYWHVYGIENGECVGYGDFYSVEAAAKYADRLTNDAVIRIEKVID